MRRGRIRAGLLLSVAVLVTSACAEPPREPEVGLTGGWETAGCEFTPAPMAVPVGSETLLSTPPALQAAMSRIEHGGRKDYPASFAGIEVDQQRVRAIVYRVPSAEFDDYLRVQAQDSCIVVRDALHGLRELGEWHDRVVADLPMWKARGITIVTVGARNDGFGVEIGTRDVDRARIVLQAYYGEAAPLIYIERKPVVPLATPSD